MANIYIGGSSGSSTLTLQTLTSSGNVIGWNSFVNCDATTGQLIVTLPTSSTATNKGQSVTITKVDSSINPIIIDGYNSETINGNPNYLYLYNQGDSIVLCNQGNGDSKISSDNRNSTGATTSFYRVTNTTGQSTNLTANSAIIFNTVEIAQGNGISFNTSTSAFTLLPGKTFKLTACIPKVNLSSGGYCYTRWYNDTTSSNIGSGSGGDAVTSTSSTMSGCITTCTITPTVATTLRCLISGQGSVTSLGDSGNIIWAECEEISRQSTVISSVDYLNVARVTSDATGITTGSDLVFNSIVSGNIPYNISTGVATLTAGKTYEFIGEPAFSSFSDATNGYLVYDWVDASTNTSLIANSFCSGLQLPINRNVAEGNNSEAHSIYTPTTNQTIKLRVTGGSGTATLRSNTGSKAIIRQIGTTANTNIPNTLVQPFTGAALSTAGTTGGVVAPTAGQQTSYLRGDNTWDNMSWQSYTPTITCSGSTFHLVTSYVMKGLYRIVGKNLQLKFIYNHNNNSGFNEGTGSSSPYAISIPSGIAINTTLAPISASLISTSGNGSGSECLPLGQGTFYSSSAPVSFPAKIVSLSSNTIGVHFTSNGTNSPYTLWGGNMSYYGGSSVELTFTCEMPIV